MCFRKANRTGTVLPVSCPAFPVDYKSEENLGVILAVLHTHANSGHCRVADEAACFFSVHGSVAYYLHSQRSQ